MADDRFRAHAQNAVCCVPAGQQQRLCAPLSNCLVLAVCALSCPQPGLCFGVGLKHTCRMYAVAVHNCTPGVGTCIFTGTCTHMGGGALECSPGLCAHICGCLFVAASPPSYIVSACDISWHMTRTGSVANGGVLPHCALSTPTTIPSVACVFVSCALANAPELLWTASLVLLCSAASRLPASAACCWPGRYCVCVLCLSRHGHTGICLAQTC